LESGYARAGVPDGSVHTVSVAGVSGSSVTAVTPEDVSTARATPARAAAPKTRRVPSRAVVMRSPPGLKGMGDAVCST
jgi:hypothetical protein